MASKNSAVPNTQSSAKTAAAAAWPGAFGVYKPSRDAVRINVWTLVFLGLLTILISFMMSLLFHGRLTIVADLISVAFQVAYTTLLLDSVRAKECGFGDSFRLLDARMYFNMLLLGILSALALIGSLLALVVPFFFVLPRISLASYYVVDQKMSGIDALKASWAATKGHSLKVWGVIGVNILFLLLFAVLLITIIGALFAIYFWIMYSAALTLLYMHVEGKAAAAPAKPAVPDQPYPNVTA